jgi:hypothetical protein
MSDLLARLERAEDDPKRHGEGWYCCDCGELLGEAKKEIERLQNENNRLNANARLSLGDDVHETPDPVFVLCILYTSAKAEVERLRAENADPAEYPEDFNVQQYSEATQ